MNKPVAKEPSMDEILSSIRQIIADDDAGRRPGSEATSPEPARPTGLTSMAPAAIADAEPLALTMDQIVRPAAAGFNAAAPLVDTDDVSFEIDEPAPVVTPAPPPAALRTPQPVAPPLERPRPAAAIAEAAPMPDPQLSGDIADELIEPATNAAVRSTFARLQNLGIGTQGLTIEALMRDMLRPMLKEWLDENLPSVVERMVEKEIARISRGLD